MKEVDNQKPKTQDNINKLPPLEIILPQNYLWDDLKFLYIWPQCLMKAIAGISYTITQIREEIFGQVKGGQSKANRARDVLGVIKENDNCIRIQGVGIFEESFNGNIISAEAQAMVLAFREDNKSIKWKRLLAELVLKYDIRVRAVLYYIGALGFNLYTESNTALTASPARKTRLVRDDISFYLYEKTLVGHLLDCIDFVELISEISGDLCIPSETVQNLVESIFKIFIHCEGLPGSGIIEEGSLEIVNTLSETLAVAKAILYYLENSHSNTNTRQTIRKLRQRLVPFYFTKTSLGTRFETIKAQKNITKSLELISSEIESLLKSKSIDRVNLQNKSYNELINELRMKVSMYPIDMKTIVLNKMIYSHIHEIVGPYTLTRAKRAGVETDRELIIRGDEQRFQYEPPSSRNQFSIPKALQLLEEIGVLVHSEQGWTIDPLAAMELDNELTKQLFTPENASIYFGDAYLLKILEQSYNSVSLKSGYASAVKLGVEVCKRLHIKEAKADYMCQMITRFSRNGMIDVRYKTSLPRYGSGLCSDPKKRLILIEFLNH